jgi:membrane-bound metal-dependent hydrolase YbcI (DUF457 family)
MNAINHFLLSFNLLLIIFGYKIPIWELALFSVIFAVLIDLHQIIGWIERKPRHHKRTWLEEPPALFIIALPIAILLSLLRSQNFLLVMIPYGVHILLDYLTIHEVSPLAPFSKKKYNTGIFHRLPKKEWFSPKDSTFSEGYVLTVNIIIIASILAIYLT